MESFEKLKNVPIAIRRWLGSEDVVNLIIEIEQRFQLPEDEIIIPSVLFDVMVKDLPLESLAEVLAATLEVSSSTATAIYQEIKVKIMLPIAPELVANGIGTVDLAFAAKVLEPAPVPVGATASLTSRAPSAAPVPTAPTPRPFAVPAAPAVAPVPLTIYRDALASQSSIAQGSRWNVGSPIGSGDLASGSGGGIPTPRAIRPAHIDLGTASSSRMDQTLKSIFVQHETPKLQEVDYAAARVPTATIPSMPVIPAAPVPLADAPHLAVPAAPAITPRVEVVSIPAADPAGGEPEGSGGLVGSIMRKILPWHYAKFGASRGRAVDAISNPVPSKSVDYSADAAIPAPTAPQASSAPLPDAPLPPTSEVPAPPKA